VSAWEHPRMNAHAIPISEGDGAFGVGLNRLEWSGREGS